jgi:hypothetical protein
MYLKLWPKFTVLMPIKHEATVLVGVPAKTGMISANKHLNSG